MEGSPNLAEHLLAYAYEETNNREDQISRQNSFKIHKGLRVVWIPISQSKKF